MNLRRFGVIFLALLWCAFAVKAQSRDEFKQMLAQLQQNPADDALRERIIRAAVNLDPAPAIPEDARRNLIEGMTLHQEAKNPADEKIALEAFAKAAELAPWWGDVYLGKSVSEELTGQLEEAEKSLRFYLLSNPGEEKARSAQDHIYVLAAKKKKAQAAVQSSQQQVQQRKALTGWWQCKTGCTGYKWIQSDGSDLKIQVDRWSFEAHFDQDALTGLATLPAADDPDNLACTLPEQKHRMTGFLEENATVMRLKYELTSYQSRAHWQPDPILGNLSRKHICDGVTPIGTSPQELALVGGAKENYFGVAMTTITPALKDLPDDKETQKAVKEGYSYCKRSQKVEAAGVLITAVEPSTSAAVAGLKAGDIIHAQNHISSRNLVVYCTADQFFGFLKRIPPGGKFAVDVFDGPKSPRLYEFTMGVRGEPMQANPEDHSGKKSRRRK